MPSASTRAGRPAKQAPVPPADRMRRCRQRKKREAGEGAAGAVAAQPMGAAAAAQPTPAAEPGAAAKDADRPDDSDPSLAGRTRAHVSNKQEFVSGLHHNEYKRTGRVLTCGSRMECCYGAWHSCRVIAAPVCRVNRRKSCRRLRYSRQQQPPDVQRRGALSAPGQSYAARPARRGRRPVGSRATVRRRAHAIEDSKAAEGSETAASTALQDELAVNRYFL